MTEDGRSSSDLEGCSSIALSLGVVFCIIAEEAGEGSLTPSSAQASSSMWFGMASLHCVAEELQRSDHNSPRKASKGDNKDKQHEDCLEPKPSLVCPSARIKLKLNSSVAQPQPCSGRLPFVLPSPLRPTSLSFVGVSGSAQALARQRRKSSVGVGGGKGKEKELAVDRRLREADTLLEVVGLTSEEALALQRKRDQEVARRLRSLRQCEAIFTSVLGQLYPNSGSRGSSSKGTIGGGGSLSSSSCSCCSSLSSWGMAAFSCSSSSVGAATPLLAASVEEEGDFPSKSLSASRSLRRSDGTGATEKGSKVFLQPLGP